MVMVSVNKTIDGNGLRLEKKKRSRLGCKNCKLRGIKCDESKPACQRCVQYGVLCSYASKLTGDTLQFSSEQEIVILSGEHQLGEVKRFDLKVPEYLSYWPTRTDQLISKFQLITAPTISTGERTTLYCTEVVNRARLYPFMQNALLALSSMHERSVTRGTRSKPTAEEAEYCYLAVSQFSKEVVKPRNPEHQGLLLCAASMIYNLTFASLEATTPEEAWPLAPADPRDLGWLKVSAAKTQIAQLAKPIGEDILFSTLSSSFPPEIFAKYSAVEPATLPLGFSSLFDLDSNIDPVSNPYFVPATRLSRVLEIDDIIFVSLNWIITINEVTEEFKLLLGQKDPRALLLLACWFAKISNMPVWWYRQRAIIEGQAICIYLERFHTDDMRLQVLLRFPRSIFARLPGWDIYPATQEEADTNSPWSQTTTPTASTNSAPTPT